MLSLKLSFVKEPISVLLCQWITYTRYGFHTKYITMEMIKRNHGYGNHPRLSLINEGSEYQRSSQTLTRCTFNQFKRDWIQYWELKKLYSLIFCFNVILQLHLSLVLNYILLNELFYLIFNAIRFMRVLYPQIKFSIY